MRTPGVSLLIGAAGYGKTAWLDTSMPDGAVVRSADRTTPEELAALVAVAPPAVAVEDLHLLLDSDRAELLRALATLDPSVTLALTSRRPLTAKERAALRGPVFELGPADLALSPAQVATLLMEEYAVDDPELPSLVHHATAGWPMAVHLFAAALSRRPSLGSGQLPRDAVGSAAAAAADDPATSSWWETAVLPDLADEVAELLTTLARFDVLTTDLVTELWTPDASWVTDAYDTLCRVGLVVPHPRAAILGLAGSRVVPALAAHLSPTGGVDDEQRVRRAAAWYERHDHPMAALRCHLNVHDTAAATSLLDRAGGRMLAQGDASELVPLLDPGSGRAVVDLTPDRRTLLAEGLLLTGHPDEAQGMLRPLVRAADADGWQVGLAVRAAAISYARSDLPKARSMLDRVAPESVPPAGDGIRWRTLRVIVDSQRGDADAPALARSTMELAEESGEPGDLSLAHQAMAKVSPGHTMVAHLDRAATYARAAGDATAMAPILCNQGFALLAAADFGAAAAVSREAVRISELVRPIGALVVALHNLAEALCRLGEFEEARWHLRRAASVGRTLGGGRVASSLSGLGDLHRALGQREQARQAYEQAVALARESDEKQVLVPALAGLARLVVFDDVEEARTLARAAVQLATPGLEAYPLIALAWVELGAGDRARALTLAGEAAAAAREDHALDLLADALEVRGAAEEDPAKAREAFLESLAIWRDTGADPDASRIEVRIARLEDADRRSVDRGRAAAARLQRLGVSRIGDRPLGDDPMAKDVRVLVLGGFEVLISGRPVSLQAWRSRQARTLVKLLAARRGRPASRGQLCEELWPDDDPVKTSHRLSVLLTTVRSVMDPERAWPTDHYLASDKGTVWLDVRRVGIDADELIRDADHGATLLAEGHDQEAGELLADVDRRFTGEAFEDEPYESWSVDLREESRTAWLRSLRHLATLAIRQGRHNDAVAILARLLRADPYDEKVHRGLVRTLVRAGRHGEARRAFRQWTEAMAAVDAPAPDPRVLTPPTGQGP